MDSSEIALVRGFDLFFIGASEKTLKNIAKDIGGKSSFNVAESKATYMCIKEHYIDLNKLYSFHKIANEQGERYALSFGCEFAFSELYISVTKDSKLMLEPATYNLSI